MKAVLFDFNGTLLFDTEKHAAAWDAFARRWAGRPLPYEEYRDCLGGKDNRSTVEYLLGFSVPDERRKAMSAEKEQIYFGLCRSDPDFSLAPGAVELLDELKRRGIPYGIATSAGAYNMDFYFETLHLGNWFNRETQIICADGKLPSKPAPDIYLKAMARLGVAPADCLVFEDLPTGIASAVASGAGRVVAIASAQEPAVLAALPGVERALPDFTTWREYLDL